MGDTVDQRVVITGLAATTCLGTDAVTTWKNILDGVCGMGEMPAVESALPPGSVGGQAAELPGGYCPALPREARYLRWTVEAALRDAALVRVSGRRTAAVVGTTLHGIRAGGRFLRSGDTRELDTFLAGATVSLALRDLGITKGTLTTCSACSSSLGAVALGVTLLRTGTVDAVIAGGYDAMSEYSWAGFNSLRLIAEGPLRPFCRGRTGMKVAEGYGIVILERANDAEARGAPSRACVAGWGESADAHHLTQPHPQGEGATTAMRQAVSQAGLTPADLGFAAAHATGTPDNDGAEYRALASLMGEHLNGLPVVGFKSFLGHTLGGAGAVELVMSALTLRDQRIPACPNVSTQDVEFEGLQVACGSPQTREIRGTLNTSLGFGGANTCVVLTPRPAQQPASSARTEAVISGVGVVLPGAVGHAAFAAQLRSGGPRPATIDDASLAEFMNVKRARRLSQYVKYTLAAASMAVTDARLKDTPDLIAASAALLGSMHGSASFCFDYYSQIVREGALAANPVLFAEGVPNAAAAHLSTTLGIKGACQTIIGTRTSGLDALALAALRVQSGAVHRVIVVAAEECAPIMDRVYRAAGLMAPEGKEEGFVSSQGAVAFVVESSEAAAARGVEGYAVVAGSAFSSADRGAAAAVASALSRVGAAGRLLMSPTGTWLDRAERIGARRARIVDAPAPAAAPFGEVFSVTPLVGLAAGFATDTVDGRITSLCTDWTGCATAVAFDRLSRRVGV